MRPSPGGYLPTGGLRTRRCCLRAIGQATPGRMRSPRRPWPGASPPTCSWLRPWPRPTRAVVAIGAAALEAQPAWAHAGIATGPTRFPRKRRRVRFVPRPRRPAAAYLGPPGPVLPAVPGHTRPAGMHTLCIGLGPDGGARPPMRGLRALCAAAGPVGAPGLLPLCRPGCGLGGRPAPGVGAGVPPHDPCGPAGRAECPLWLADFLGAGHSVAAPLVPCAPAPCGRVGCGRWLRC